MAARILKAKYRTRAVVEDMCASSSLCRLSFTPAFSMVCMAVPMPGTPNPETVVPSPRKKAPDCIYPSSMARGRVDSRSLLLK